MAKILAENQYGNKIKIFTYQRELDNFVLSFDTSCQTNCQDDSNNLSSEQHCIKIYANLLTHKKNQQ